MEKRDLVLCAIVGFIVGVIITAAMGLYLCQNLRVKVDMDGDVTVHSSLFPDRDRDRTPDRDRDDRDQGGDRDSRRIVDRFSRIIGEAGDAAQEILEEADNEGR